MEVVKKGAKMIFENLFFSGFDIAMFVMHPFLRLVSSFKKIQTDGHKLVEQWAELHNTIPGADKPELNFQV